VETARELSRRFSEPHPRPFYDRPAEPLARALLGAFLLRKRPSGWSAARLVETEAYSSGDPASHAFRGPTERNRSMFGLPGTLYVYRIHQVHCANAVGRRGEAVLLRAAEPRTPDLGNVSGPGRLCRAFGITREDDGRDLTADGELRIVPGPAPREPIVALPRVGISRATEVLARFALAGNRWVSAPRPPAPGAEAPLGSPPGPGLGRRPTPPAPRPRRSSGPA
jgi:DNA-3-methyladenine glycosylase